MSEAADSTQILTLVRLFYASLEQLGQFALANAQNIPELPRSLLDHNQHMTVTVEAWQGVPVEVDVLARHQTATHYARKILLRRSDNRRAVQFGIMRVSLPLLSTDVRAAILQAAVPLGRLLLQHGVLTEVKLCELWRIHPAAELAGWLGSHPGEPLYGRTAVIDCDGVRAVELLEIVAPAPTASRSNRE
jgi:chorismate-pyruvate lyase